MPETAHIEVRQARWSDLRWLCRLHLATFASTVPLLRRLTMIRYLLGFVWRRRCWVATIDGDPVGYGAVLVVRARSSELHALAGMDLDQSQGFTDAWAGPGDWRRHVVGSWRSVALAVEPAHRRRGIGTRLVEARIEAARAAGAQAVFVDCVIGSGSEHLYARRGFEAICEVDGPLAGGAALRVMVLPLRPPAELPAPHRPSFTDWLVWQRRHARRRSDDLG